MSHATPASSARSRRRKRQRALTQQELAFPNTWGGRRKGAGRKPGPGRRPVPHRPRPRHQARHPVHVTLRSSFRPLRSQHVFPTVCLALGRSTRRKPERFRILQFSVQWDHIHLVVEASDARALSSGVRSVTIRIARYVNHLLGRRGPLWADRWHGRELTSPRQVRNALAYVLQNFRKHVKARLRPGIDAFSSAARFDGWRGFAVGAVLPRAGPPLHRTLARHVVVSAPSTWLGRTGWRRSGLIRVDETPG
jgi:REP element-mobilizing transposase RayT